MIDGNKNVRDRKLMNREPLERVCGGRGGPSSANIGKEGRDMKEGRKKERKIAIVQTRIDGE